ncbi:hypothetical protein EWM64_g3851, partial [Hericium alpestre]
MNSNQPNVSNTTPPAALLLPTELLREIVLYRLANAFWDLLVEPDLDKDWDPLTPFLHASSQFRHITTNLLGYIIGEPSLDDNPRRVQSYAFPPILSLTSTFRPRVQYQAVLNEIKRLRNLLATADPNETVAPDAPIYRQIVPHEDCTSPILWHARGIVTLSLHLRMLDAAHESSGLEGSFRGFMGAAMELVFRDAKMPTSIRDAVFMPLHVRYFAMDTLAQRIMLLSKACGAICELLPDFLCVTEEQFQIVEPEFDKFLKPLSRPRDFREYLPTAESLPIPPPTLEALQFRERERGRRRMHVPDEKARLAARFVEALCEVLRGGRAEREGGGGTRSAGDAVAAWALVRIWKARSGVAANAGAREGVVLASYLLNPYLLLPSLALSTATFDNALILLTLMFASEGASSAALLSLALAVHLSLPSLLLLPPVILLLHSTPHSHLASPNAAPSLFASISSDKSRTARMLGVFAAFFPILCVASRVVAGSWSWIGNTWGAGFILPDLTPNPGLWWYFFTEMFDHFRPFFLMVFSVHLLIYVAPLCIKFQHDPLYATFLLLGVLALFKPYPTLADPGLFTSLLALFPESYAHLRHAPVTFLLHLHAALLLPLFHHLWTRAGTGNANFFYASTLVLGIAN